MTRCSDAAAERADPLLGTAPPQRRWLLVEHPGPWPVSAPYGVELSGPLLARLGHPDLRVVLVRRHGRRHTGDERRWFLSAEGSVRAGTWRRPEDLLAAERPGAGAAYDRPLLLVCTHGVHDVCCAVRGRPVAAALSARWPESTWECSHLGGDRFAASVLVLPDAACYGGLDAQRALATVQRHLDGRVDATSLRGVAGLHPAEQVALGRVLEQWGPAAVTAAEPSTVAQEGPLDDGRWTVDVAGTAPLPELVRVVVRSRRVETPARLTCRATRETAAIQWDVEQLAPA